MIILSHIAPHPTVSARIKNSRLLSAVTIQMDHIYTGHFIDDTDHVHFTSPTLSCRKIAHCTASELLLPLLRVCSLQCECFHWETFQCKTFTCQLVDFECVCCHLIFTCFEYTSMRFIPPVMTAQRKRLAGLCWHDAVILFHYLNNTLVCGFWRLLLKAVLQKKTLQLPGNICANSSSG